VQLTEGKKILSLLLVGIYIEEHEASYFTDFHDFGAFFPYEHF
jgi:hypothetical protein